MAKRKKEEPEEERARVNPELEGFEIKIDSFGEIKSNLDIEKINEFLNRKLYDKKLKNLPEDGEEEEDTPKG
jgi:hypothetical protein